MRGLPGSLGFPDLAAGASATGAGAGVALTGAGQSAAAGLLPFLPLLVVFVFLVWWRGDGADRWRWLAFRFLGRATAGKDGNA